ncbi:SDR family oxidoreductase [Hoyosella subflava]|uniref:Putative short chain dehydrogenase n=1 Tax=Hoyosella subflava (strain DSM 45089 / JCM 17490 / NBRC 109087 / DQS3-9A1) TaxID=443218 RepID=F6ENQ1_HOYSD|nr:SDR family oxidoreductase [Hoyosella subflava]AEF42908.1 Putative short chain dehydrogenase [Hoyosella subflava DQS3-9A1]
MIELRGAKVCVTGGARGIGRATAEELIARGAEVWIGDRDLAAAAETAVEIGATAHPLDVTDEVSFRAFLAAAGADGPIDMLVNNAGIQLMGGFADQNLAAVRRELAVNLGAVLTGVHLVLPGMRLRRRGHIVNVASMAGKVTTPGIATYCASKFGVVAFSRALRAELSGSGVTVTSVLPAATQTDLTSGVRLRLQPILTPEQVAAAVADSAHHNRGEVTVPRWLAPLGLVEELTPTPILWWLKRFVGGAEYGGYDPVQRKDYLDRIFLG